LLHAESFLPEKRLADLAYAQMQATSQANTAGPALVMRHIALHLHSEREV